MQRRIVSYRIISQTRYFSSSPSSPHSTRSLPKVQVSTAEISTTESSSPSDHSSASSSHEHVDKKYGLVGTDSKKPGNINNNRQQQHVSIISIARR
mmetsp:Transcript_16793/g.36650  ORF Transcript_16793/g.36650 Transcript_16793/m.36650 type:complete len:96 (+) Transcript_16793:222-509(+)